MPPLRQAITRDIRRTAVEIGNGTAPFFVWKEKNIDCVPSSVRRGLEMEVGGNSYTVGLTLIVLCEDFLTADNTLTTIDTNLYTADNDEETIDDSSINASAQPITADSDLPVPVAGRTLVFRGQTLLIVSARESGPRSHFELTLADGGSNR